MSPSQARALIALALALTPLAANGCGGSTAPTSPDADLAKSAAAPNHPSSAATKPK